MLQYVHYFLKLSPFCSQIIGSFFFSQIFEKVVVQKDRDFLQECGINAFFSEDFVDVPPVVTQLFGKPFHTTSLFPKYFLYVLSYVHKKGVNCSFICLFISRSRPSYLCTTSTNQFTPQREHRLVILVHEIWSYFEIRIKSVKLSILFQIFLFLVFVLRLYFCKYIGILEECEINIRSVST